MKKLLWFLVVLWIGLPTVYGKSELPIISGIGGDFLMESTLDKQVRLSDFRGKALLLFFGYTNCPDLCPLTIAHISQLMEKLGDQSDEVQVLFATIDPTEDTPEVLKAYLNYFDPRFVGLTGGPKQVEKMLSAYQVEYSQLADMPLKLDIKVTQRTGKTKGTIYSHTSNIYLFDKNTQLRSFYYIGTPVDKMKDDVQSLLQKAPTLAEQKDIEIINPWVRDMPPTSKVTAAYMTIKNHSNQDEKLIGLSSSIAKEGQWHVTQIENSNAHMKELLSIVIPANGAVVLKPGAQHGMLMGLEFGALQRSETVPLILTFEQRGMKRIDAPIQKTSLSVTQQTTVDASHHEHH